MAVFQCKMCGGSLDVTEGQSVATCEYCGSKQTVPKLGDDKINKILQRANTLRLNGEYDKAIEQYEKITDEEAVSDAEIYWNIVLCKYGIQYVDDPSTGKKVPTINRTQVSSILSDDNYLSALEYADPTTKQMYVDEANYINKVQQGILAISQNEEPYDIFICYKETDDGGQRTKDSVMAYDMYHYLTEEGFRVFFARVSLEDKVGSEYEPFIFAALNSAKVMVVIGSKKEYFEAPWVKNEWSRYLELLKKDRYNKLLIPCYRDMDPYELPKEMAMLQAQDMNKLGFMQDLIRGIKKVCKKDQINQQLQQGMGQQIQNQGMPVQSAATQIIKKAKIFIEQGDIINANKNLDVAFDMEPENWEIYLCKLLMDFHLKNESELKNLRDTFESNYNYIKIMQYAEPKIAERIKGYNDFIVDRLANENAGKLYDNAENLFMFKEDNQRLSQALAFYKKIPKYKDSEQKAKTCIEQIYSNVTHVIDDSTDVTKIENAIAALDYIATDMDVEGVRAEGRNKIIYSKGMNVLNAPITSVAAINQSINELNTIRSFEGASDLIYNLQTKAVKIERDVKKAKRISVLTGIFVGFGVLCFVLISMIGAKLATNGFKSSGVPDEPQYNDKFVQGKCKKYLIDGSPVRNTYVNYKGNKVRADENGVLLMNYWDQVGDGKYQFIDEEGKKVVNQFKEIDSNQGKNVYAFDQTGYMVSNGFYKIGDKNYYFDADGHKVVSNIAKHQGRTYLFDDSGNQVTEKGERILNGGKEYYIKDNGEIANGEFVKTDNGEFLYSTDGTKVIDDWGQDNDGNYYHMGTSGTKDIGVLPLEGKEYLLNNNGVMLHDEWVVFTDGKPDLNDTPSYTANSRYAYYDGNGARQYDNLANLDGKIYGFKEGYLINKEGWDKIGGVDYYIGADGVVATNTIRNSGGKMWYVGPDGKVQISNIPGGYLVDGDGSILVNKEVNGVYYGSNGKPLTGAHPLGGKYYENGRPVTNRWVGDYWIDGSGQVAKNQWVDNNQYYVGADGVYLSNQAAPDGSGKYLGADGKVVAGASASSGKTESQQDITLISTKHSVKYSGVPCVYYTISDYDATNKGDQAQAMVDAVDEAEEEITDWLKDLCESSPKPKEINLAKWTPGSATTKKAVITTRATVKKSSGKTTSRNIKITIDLETDTYEIDGLDSVDLD